MLGRVSSSILLTSNKAMNSTLVQRACRSQTRALKHQISKWMSRCAMSSDRVPFLQVIRRASEYLFLAAANISTITRALHLWEFILIQLMFQSRFFHSEAPSLPQFAVLFDMFLVRTGRVDLEV